MKNRLILILIGTFISCHSYREKTNLENNRISLSEANKGIRYGFQLVEQDSLNRSWSFVTDSILYFHPDSGLYSYGGYLQINESQLGLQQWQVELDSFDTKRNVHGITESQTQSRRWFDYSWWFWGIVGGCAWFVYRVVR